jgi:hypothetical protein
MPPDDRLWLDNGDGIHYRRKQAIEPDEEQSIGHRTFRLRGYALAQHIQLMPQQHDLGFQSRLRFERWDQDVNEQLQKVRAPMKSGLEVYGCIFAAILLNLVADLLAFVEPVQPARSTAPIWTNTSLPPLSGWMKPKPFWALNHFTVPEAMISILEKVRKSARVR